jgi:protein tyrosine phosphatase
MIFNIEDVQGYKRPKAYIATQGPKPQTVDDFWRMVWHEKVSLIVMVANVTENGKVRSKIYAEEISKTCNCDDLEKM